MYSEKIKGTDKMTNLHPKVHLLIINFLPSRREYMFGREFIRIVILFLTASK